MVNIHKHSPKPPFFPLPMFVTHLDLSPGAMVLYARLYSRCMLSIENGFLDEDNNAYCFYSVDSMAQDMKCSRRTIQSFLKSLEDNDLIERHRKGPFSNRIYVKQTFYAYREKLSEEERINLISEATEREEVLRAKERWEALHGKFVFPDFKAKEKTLPS